MRRGRKAAPLLFCGLPCYHAPVIVHPRTAVTIETATDQPTFSQFIGIRILEITPDSVKAELPSARSSRTAAA